MPDDRTDIVYLRVHHGDREDEGDNDDGDENERLVVAPKGATLRDVLVDRDLSPYARVTERVNCGGRGLCATCGVRVEGDAPPDHWHDRAADRLGYPRLSCQIRLDGDLTVRLVADKLVWGGRDGGR